MSRSQYLIIFASLCLIAGLYSMPKAVVKNEGKSSVSQESHTESEQEHQAVLPPDKVSLLAQLKDNLARATGEQAQLSAIDTLIGAFKAVNQYDSAAKYAEDFSNRFADEKYKLRAGELYYEAYTYAVDAEKTAKLAAKARELLEQFVAKHPQAHEVKVKIGMTYVASANPMQGILMIREVLNDSPDNRFALFNLGILAMQSGQYDKALARFERIVALDSKDIQSRFYLGICYKELNQPKEAVEAFEFVKKHEQNPDILATVNQYLSQLKK